jgi:hypothetical protein
LSPAENAVSVGLSIPYGDDAAVDLAWNEVTGAIGDSVTVVPLVVAVAVLTDRSLGTILCWFGAVQIVWGLRYGVPVSVEPMKALVALLLAGAITAGEFLLAGLLAGAVLLGLGVTGTLARVGRHVGTATVRGVQFGVALVLFETGVRLGVGDLRAAAVAVGVAAACVAVGRRELVALAVLAVGGAVAGARTGVPTPALPPVEVVAVGRIDPTVRTAAAAASQLAMTVGNAALAASVLLSDYFDRDVSADDLSTSMGVTNLLAVPLGGLPMCHGSGGIAGKYAFGARTAGANVVLGVGYVVAAVCAVELVAAYPLAMLGVVLAVVAAGLGRTSLRATDARAIPAVVAVGVVAVVANVGAAFLLGLLIDLRRRRRRA